MLQDIRSALTVFGLLSVIGIPGYFAYEEFTKKSPQDYVNTHSGILKTQSKWILAKQVQNYSSLQSAKEWYSTKAWIYYKWRSENEYGIDFANGDWDWQLEYNQGIASVTVPKLEYFGPKINLGKEGFQIKVVNKALGISETDMIEKYYDEMQRITQEDGKKKHSLS